MSKIIGNIQTQAVQGAINAKNTLQGKVALGEGVAQIYDTYNGEYEVTPSTEMQHLETKNKVMDDDVTIKRIPFYEVTNETGGTTITIGREV